MISPNKKLKIGVLGIANVAERKMIPAMLRTTEYFNLFGLASRSPEKAKLAAAQFKTQFFDSYQALLEADGIDAVYIPLPNSLHTEWVEASLNRGLHVLVEKSLTTNPEDTIRLCKIAESNGLALVENFQFRFHRQLQKIKDILASGVIGELRSVRSSFGFPPFPDKENIRYQAALGGGALMDAGAYPLKISQIILGQNLDVCAGTLNTPRGYEVDIWGGAYLKQTQGDLFSEISFGFDHHYQCGLEIWGSLGKLSTNRIFTAPPEFSPTLHVETQAGTRVIEVEPDDHFMNMLLHFYRICQFPDLRGEEYSQNKNQARLLNELRERSHGR